MLEARLLSDAPGAAYFLTAVKHTALRRLGYGWTRYIVALDPETPVIIERVIARGVADRDQGAAAGSAAGHRPRGGDFLIISSEDQRPSHVACYIEASLGP